MAQARRSIQRLSSETQKQIQSSVQLTSLLDVVLELVRNSLDAEARTINIRLDFAKGYCSVSDDGVGIHQNEFSDNGGLARPYRMTNSSYGRYGHFLASLAQIAHLHITSSETSTISAKTLVLNYGRRITTNLDGEEEQAYGKKGTKVTVHNLFGNLPVRVKQRMLKYGSQAQLEKEFFEVKIQLASLIMAYSLPICLDVADTSGLRQFNYNPINISPGQSSLEKITSILSQAGFIGIDMKDWRMVTVKTSQLRMSTAICCRPSPTKRFQFVSIGKVPVTHQLLLEEANRLFHFSSSSEVDQDIVNSGKGHPTDVQSQSLESQQVASRNSGHNAKVLDKWTMFYIRLDMLEKDHEMLSQSFDVDKWTDKQIETILDLLRITVEEFLTSQGHSKKTKSTCLRAHPRKKTISLTIQRRSDHFADWSRVKAAKPELACDILTGLPFLRTNQDEYFGRRAHHSRQYDDSEAEHDEHSCPQRTWTNPTTGQVMHLNARTGTVLPDQSSNQSVQQYDPSPIATGLKFGPCNLEDTVRSLQLNKWIRNSVEMPISSVSTSYDRPIQYDTAYQDRNSTINEILVHQNLLSPNITTSTNSNITKAALDSARIVGQVDKKFVLLSVHLEYAHLVMVDQHAADERIKLEKLLREICADNQTVLPKPINFTVTPIEARLFKNTMDYLSSWKISMEIEGTNIRVKALPELIAERCFREPKLLTEMLRREVWDMPTDHSLASDDWLVRIGSCPRGLLELLVSRACRSAIMFNDTLRFEECQMLVCELTKCHFPFQCAHGRPSMTTLTRLEDLDDFGATITFRQAWDAWVDL